MKQTGWVRVLVTVLRRDSTSSSISGDVGVEGVISWCFPGKKRVAGGYNISLECDS